MAGIFFAAAGALFIFSDLWYNKKRNQKGAEMHG